MPASAICGEEVELRLWKDIWGNLNLVEGFVLGIFLG